MNPTSKADLWRKGLEKLKKSRLFSLFYAYWMLSRLGVPCLKKQVDWRLTE